MLSSEIVYAVNTLAVFGVARATPPNLAVTANTYAHVLVDETEIDYAALVD